MSRFALVLAASAAALAVGPAAGAAPVPACATGCFAAPAGSGALFIFTGHGYGHGVGMSQYGAFGYAQHGSTYQQILAHYYPGTTLGHVPATTIRVLLANGAKTLTLTSAKPFSVVDADGGKHKLAAGTISLDSGLKLAVDGAASPTALTGPLTFVPAAGAPLTLKRPYRGKIQVDVVSGHLRAIDLVGLEPYLDGVVPSEMPSNWAPAALEAQAVAARSYALATRRVGAPFDVYPDSRDQVYFGLSNESPATTAAVAATKGQVVLFDGKVATTYFSSTSGGETESSLDWKGVAVPYLVSVPDPYDSISPYHDWGPVAVTAKAIAKALKMKGSITDVTTTPDAAGRVGLLDLVTGTSDVSVPAATLRAALGLRSTWFDVGVLALDAAQTNAVPYGSKVSLTGTVRGLAGVKLEQRPAGGSWQSVSAVSSSSGPVTMSAKPTKTTDYRLATTVAAAPSVRVRVMPAVTVSVATTAEIAGSVRPALPGAPVRVERQAAGGAWTTAVSGSAAADGTFDLPVRLAAGATYRVVVAPGNGYAQATTQPQVLPG